VGEWGRGKVLNKYVQGQRINLTLELAEDLGGYFNVKLCPLTLTDPLETQSCLDRHPLELTGGRDSTAYWPQAGERVVSVSVRIPGDLACQACVLQWSYYTSNISDSNNNNNNKDYSMFRACADLAIVGQDLRTTGQEGIGGEVVDAGWADGDNGGEVVDPDNGGEVVSAGLADRDKGGEVMSAGWADGLTDWWKALLGLDEEVELDSSEIELFTNSSLPSSRSVNITRVSGGGEGKPIAQTVSSPGPEETITRIHLDTTSVRPKYKVSELDNPQVSVTRNVTKTGAQTKQTSVMGSIENGSKYRVSRPLPPVTFTKSFNGSSASSRGEILNGSLDQTSDDYLGQKEKLTPSFNKTMTAEKKSVNSTTFSSRHDKPNQTKDDSWQTKTDPNISQIIKLGDSAHKVINHFTDKTVQHEVTNESTSKPVINQITNNSKQHEIMNGNPHYSTINQIQNNITIHSSGNSDGANQSKSIKHHSKYIQTVKPPDEIEVNPYYIRNLTINDSSPRYEPNKTKNQTETITAAAIGISIMFVLMCFGIIFILFIKKYRQVGASKKVNNSSLYDEAPTRWSDINLSLPTDYEIVPSSEPDSSGPKPPSPTLHPPPSTIITVDRLLPDYANIPDVVPLSARSRKNGSSPNLLHRNYDDNNETNCGDPEKYRDLGDLEGVDLENLRTNPSSPRAGRERVRCQSEHEAAEGELETFHHDQYSKSQEDVMHGEVFLPRDYTRSQEDILSTGAECAQGGSSTFPPVAQAKSKKTLYSRISKRWGSEDWDQDESFLAMLAVRLTRMQSRPEITEL